MKDEILIFNWKDIIIWLQPPRVRWRWQPVWPVNIRQKLPKNDFTSINEDFDTFTKIDLRM